jgi:sugar O-acyltransferase (sialic acid O-acetyltransferase NeuD family)
MHEKIILQGGGEHARVVLDVLLETEWPVLAIFDPKYSGDLFGVTQQGIYGPRFHPEAKAVVAIGDNRIRKKVAATTEHAFTNVIHPSASISKRAQLGVGNMVLHHVIVQAQSKIGNHVILNTGSQIDHDCIIHDHVHVAPGAVICGTVKIGEGTFIGAGAVVIPGKTIGAWVTVGAGSVVIQDIPDYAVVVGNPARIIKYADKNIPS